MPDSASKILSLKNIYQLLVKDDYPLPSRTTIKKASIKGTTLLTFWRGIFSGSLDITPVGKRLWAPEADRPRYLSDILNRSRPYDIYPEYFKAVSDIINPAVLLGITDKMARFLLTGEYSTGILNTRLSSFIKTLEHHDSYVTPAIQAYFSDVLWLKPEFESQVDRQTFYDAYLLSVLSLHAFFGSQMNNKAMAILRKDLSFSPLHLFTVYQKRNRGSGFPQPLCLSNRSCELCREPLAAELFFGREEEMNVLNDQINRGGKMLLSGIGGIGKTELLRQVLKSVLTEGVFAQVAYVQYQDNLHESFIRSFPKLQSNSKSLKFQECADLLNSPGTGRTLLLIDNMNTPRAADETLNDLSTINCDVVITSRLASLSGYRSIPLDAPDYEAAFNIFNANYGQQLNAQSSIALDAMINMKLNRHPLMCSILGKMARAKHMDMLTLQSALEKRGLEGSYSQEAQTVRVEDVLMSLFGLSKLSAPKQRILSLFSMLPMRQYSFQTCCELFGDITHDADQLSDELESLAYLGWLQHSFSSYSMHPVIAEAVLKNKPSLDEYPDFLALLSQKIDVSKFREWDYINISYFALKNSATHSPECLNLILDTTFMLIERSITEAAGQLLEIGMKVARDSGSTAHLFDCATMQLNIRRNSSVVKGAETYVQDVLRLFPTSRGAKHCVSGIGLSLFYAWTLPLDDMKEPLLRLLTDYPWEGTDYVLHCAYMSMHQEFTSNYRLGIEWADKGLSFAAENDLLGTLDISMLYKSKALFCALCALPRESEECILQYKRIIDDWYDGVDFIELAQTTQFIGLAYFQTGEYERALPYLMESLNAFRKTLPGDTLMLVHTLNNIGNAHYRLKNFSEAIRYNRESFEVHQRMNPTPTIQSAALINNLGCIYRDIGKTSEAFELYEQAMAIAESLVDKDHICFAEVSNNLGLLYAQSGDLDKARPYFEAALPTFQKNYGDEHIKTKTAKSTLQSIYTT